MNYKKVLFYPGNSVMIYSPYSITTPVWNKIVKPLLTWTKVQKPNDSWTKTIKPPLSKTILVNE